MNNIIIKLKTMKIVYYPDKILREKTKKITKFDDNLKNIAKQMLEIMHKEKGVGLAGPQVELNQAITIIEIEAGKIKILINPEITKHSKDTVIGEEGCLSFPKIYGLVERFKKVTVKYQDLDGKTRKIKANDFLATALQHEIDHLNGIVFIDKLLKVTQNEEYLKRLLEESGENINLYK
jgi:peptide deformylase